MITLSTPNEQDISAIDLEVAVAEILLNSEIPMALTTIFKVFQQNKIGVSRQLLHYHLKRMVKLGTIIEDKEGRYCYYSLPDVLYDPELYIKLIQQVTELFQADSTNSAVFMERVILQLKIAVNYMIRGKNELLATYQNNFDKQLNNQK